MKGSSLPLHRSISVEQGRFEAVHGQPEVTVHTKPGRHVCLHLDGIPKDSSPRAGPRGARSHRTQRGGARGWRTKEVAKEEDARREFAEFWLGEHTSGHYRSLST